VLRGVGKAAKESVMKTLVKQLGSLIGAGVAAACCLGVPVVLSALGAAGLGFLIRDAYLVPIFAGFVALDLWVLFRSARSHGRLEPFWLGLAGGALGAVSLFLLVTGIFPHAFPVYGGIVLLVAGSIWDVVNGRRRAACATEACEVPAANQREPRAAKRIATGAAMSVAAAAAFYGLYKGVNALKPEAKASEIACWGINDCKGKTACTTAFNSCTGQNDCRGRGYINVPQKECAARGGVPLEGSPADPAKGKKG
jgi:mercuric ion transport protein